MTAISTTASLLIVAGPIRIEAAGVTAKARLARAAVEAQWPGPLSFRMTAIGTS
ncbi:MAG: hypothetical protein HYX75_22510 [Acidobacteria bacterium]|nr:hypothetical protein [Acidobacteriota bacterium]